MASKTAEKPRGRPFEPGNRANPNGRPTGSRNRATLLLDALAEGEAEMVVRNVLDQAKGGNLKAAELLLARAWPAQKSRVVHVKIPALKTAEDLPAALCTILEAVGNGELTPHEARSIADILEVQRRTIETAEIEARLTKLERERIS